MVPSFSLSFSGGNLEGVRSKPINAGDANLNKRVVYAPHVYGPEEYDQAYFKVSTFPNNMPDIWSRHIGFAEKQTGLPVVVGEWGAKLESGSRGQKWADALSSFLQKNCLSDNVGFVMLGNIYASQGASHARR